MITGIIMASGFSSRMEKNKLLLEVDGIKIIERVITSCKNSLLDEIILVYRLAEIKDIGESYGIKTVFNPLAHLGQSSAVILGVKSSKPSNGYMFLVGDQPFLKTQVINRLIQEYSKDDRMIIVPYYNEHIGMPIIFPNRHKDDLLIVKGDKGGREIIENNEHFVKRIYFKDELSGMDIDTMEDLEKLVNR